MFYGYDNEWNYPVATAQYNLNTVNFTQYRIFTYYSMEW